MLKNYRNVIFCRDVCLWQKATVEFILEAKHLRDIGILIVHHHKDDLPSAISNDIKVWINVGPVADKEEERYVTEVNQR